LRKHMRGPSKKPSRLSLWTGPPPQPDGWPSWLTTLCQPAALTRVCLVVGTVVVLATLAYAWGLPLPFRIGELWAHDVRARVDFQVLDEDATERAQKKIINELPPELRDDPRAQRQACASVKPQFVLIRQGETIIRHGEAITKDQRDLMLAETRAYND